MNLGRIEQAKMGLRKKLSFEYVKSLDEYKNIIEEEYKILIDSVESICLVLLESYKDKLHDDAMKKKRKQKE